MEPGTREVWWASTAWISHSAATVAVAVSDAGAVGVDVQQVTDDAVGELSPLVLADSEAGHVAGARDFFTYRGPEGGAGQGHR